MKRAVPWIACLFALVSCGGGTGGEAPEGEDQSPLEGMIYDGFSSVELAVGDLVDGVPLMVGDGEVVFGLAEDPAAIRTAYLEDLPGTEWQIMLVQVTGEFPSEGEEWCKYCLASVRLEPEAAVPLAKLSVEEGTYLMPVFASQEELASEIQNMLAKAAEGGTTVTPYKGVGGGEFGTLDFDGSVVVDWFDPAMHGKILVGGPDGAALTNSGTGSLTLDEGTAILYSSSSDAMP